MDQNKFAELTKVLVTEGPRRSLLGAIAGGTLGLVFGLNAEDAEASKASRRARKKRQAKRRAKQRAIKRRQQTCRKVNRTCQPFESEKCCSNRCCPSLGAEAASVSVCAPSGTTQCCPAELGGGYCDLADYRNCCPPTLLSPDGYCCKAPDSSCCPANSVQAADYCCPPGSHCCDSFSGCCAGPAPVSGLSASSAQPVAPQAAGRKAGRG